MNIILTILPFDEWYIYSSPFACPVFSPFSSPDYKIKRGDINLQILWHIFFCRMSIKVFNSAERTMKGVSVVCWILKHLHLILCSLHFMSSKQKFRCQYIKTKFLYLIWLANWYGGLVLLQSEEGPFFLRLSFWPTWRHGSFPSCPEGHSTRGRKPGCTQV